MGLVDDPIAAPARGRGVRHKRVTIYDVAERAGVATSTVSRALSNPGRVSAGTREQILRVARELDYAPPAATKAVVPRSRTGAVALLVPDITNPFYFDIIRGAQHQLKAAGQAHVLVDTEESAEVEAAALQRLAETADGVILTAPRLPDAQVAEAATRLPLVTVNRHIRSVSTVLIETPLAVNQAMDHLASLQHRLIAYVSGPPTSWSNQWRWHACEAAGERLGVRTVRIGPYGPTMTSGAAAADAMLNSGATACIAFNDLIAIGMLERFARRGVGVPEDLSVVGCDDIFGAAFCSPPLTTLTAPIEQAGRMATVMLMAQLDRPGSPPERTLTRLPTHLTVRGSTGPAPS